MMSLPRRQFLTALTLPILSGCASERPAGSPPETVSAITVDHRLIRFDVLVPSKILSNRPLVGLHSQDRVLCITPAGAQGWLVLGASGQLYRLAPETARLTALGSPAILTGGGREYGMALNQEANVLRVISDSGLNLRLLPETGAMIDSDPRRPGIQPDPPLQVSTGSAAWIAKSAQIAAITPLGAGASGLWAVDRGLGWLLKLPPGQPGAENTGLQPVGPLGTGPLDRAAVVRSPRDGTLYASLALRADPGRRLPPKWFKIHSQTGAATALGAIGDSEHVVAVVLDQ